MCGLDLTHDGKQYEKHNRDETTDCDIDRSPFSSACKANISSHNYKMPILGLGGQVQQQVTYKTKKSAYPGIPHDVSSVEKHKESHGGYHIPLESQFNNLSKPFTQVPPFSGWPQAPSFKPGKFWTYYSPTNCIYSNILTK